MQNTLSITDDQQIVSAFLYLVRDFSGDEVEAIARGVLQQDVSRWRKGGYKRLQGTKRRALLDYLLKQGIEREHIPTLAASYGSEDAAPGEAPADAEGPVFHSAEMIESVRAKMRVTAGTLRASEQTIANVTRVAEVDGLGVDDQVTMLQDIADAFDKANRANVERHIVFLRGHGTPNEPPKRVAGRRANGEQ